MKKMDFKQHWNNSYKSKPTESLGWYEKDLTATFRLIDKAGLDISSRILVVGAGSTMLIDELVGKKYSNVFAADLSEVSMEKLRERLGDDSNKVEWIVDDLTNPSQLTTLEPFDFWIDRAVLHFFVEENDRKTYFKLLKTLVKVGGYALLAEFSLDGAIKCSGLPVYRYSNSMFLEELGSEFELVETFDYTYTMPSGDPRPYVYSLFKRVG